MPAAPIAHALPRPIVLARVRLKGCEFSARDEGQGFNGIDALTSAIAACGLSASNVRHPGANFPFARVATRSPVLVGARVGLEWGRSGIAKFTGGSLGIGEVSAADDASFASRRDVPIPRSHFSTAGGAPGAPADVAPRVGLQWF